MIRVTVNNRRATAIPLSPVTSGAVGVKVGFIFSADWDGLNKTAVFSGSDVSRDVIVQNNECEVPWEVLTEPYGRLEIGVRGANGAGTIVIPTIWAIVGRIELGTEASEVDPADPTPSWADQVQAIATEALNTANGVRDDADNGEFDGATFTPAVATDGTLSWTNDQGKENPNPVNIRGPQGIQGETGATPVFSIGTVTAREAGTGATAEITGTPEAPVLNLGIPKGDPGEVTEQELAEAVELIEADLDTKAPVVTKTNGADFLDGADMPMKSLVVNIEPQQDLHGYDAPWAGGNGKNLFGTDDIDRLHKNVTFKSETDSAGNRIGVKLTGAYSGETATAPLGYATLSAGSYKVSGGDENVQLSIRPGSSSASQIGQVTTGETTITLESATDIYLIARVVGTFTSGLVIKPMIRLASVTDATFAPFANICPITGWTGLNGSVVGKNWLPNNLAFTDGLRNDTGAQTASNVSHYSEPFLVRPNTLYRATGTIWILNTNPRIYFLDANKNWISRTAQFTQQAFNFTTPTNCYYIQVQCSKDVDLTAGMISLDQSAAVTPYNGNTFSISWETEAGTVYSGTVDPINGTLTVDKKGITFDGSEDEAWQIVTTANRAYIAVSDIITTVPDNSIVDLKSNQYKADGYNYTGRTRITGRYNIAQINVFDYNILTGSNYNEMLAKWQAHLSEHPIQAIYPLATPIVYTLTPTEIRSLLGENHVTVDAGSIESLVYCVDTSAIIERIDEDLASLDGRVDTLEEEMDTAVEQIDTDIKAVDAKADKKAPAIYSTASGEIASFSDGADDMPMTSVVATITPKQDLNGYDHPWVGGAGKNLLPMTLANMKVINTAGTWSGNVYTYAGITYTINTDNGGNVTGVMANGTATAYSLLRLYNEITFSADTILSGCASGGSFSGYRLQADGGTARQDVGNGVTIPANEAKTRVIIAVPVDTTAQNVLFKPMIRLASVSDSTYEPYENICPITGETGASVTRCGKNLLNPNITWTTGIRDDNGNIISGGSHFTNAVYGIKPNTKYTISGTLKIETANAHRIYFLKADGTWISRTGTSVQSPDTFTTPSECGAIQIQVVDALTELSDVQLEEGSTATSFEPYNGNTFSISWQSEAGTVYSGTVDAVSGVLTVDRVAKRLTVAENLSSAYPGSMIWNTRGAIIRDADVMKPFICNRLKYVGSLATSSEWKFGTCINANGTSFNLWLKDSAFASLAEATTWLEQNETQICYYLATPIVHQLSPQQIKTLYAQNHVWTDVGEVSITYPTDTKLYVDNLFASIPTASGVSF